MATNVTLPDELARRLEEIARREQRPLAEVIALLLEQYPTEDTMNQRGILDIPPLQVDPRHPALTILSREDMYGDDGR
jgi:hypothetical protein